MGSRTADLDPNGVRAIAATVHDGGAHIVVYLPAMSAGRVLPDLLSNGQATVLFGRPVDERSCQIKGTFVDVRDVDASERVLVERQWEGFMDNLALIGIPRAVFAGCVRWPLVAIRLRVTALFEQTPGPGAGAPMS